MADSLLTLNAVSSLYTTNPTRNCRSASSLLLNRRLEDNESTTSWTVSSGDDGDKTSSGDYVSLSNLLGPESTCCYRDHCWLEGLAFEFCATRRLSAEWGGRDWFTPQSHHNQQLHQTKEVFPFDRLLEENPQPLPPITGAFDLALALAFPFFFF